jgi:hypothetical protein
VPLLRTLQGSRPGGSPARPSPHGSIFHDKYHTRPIDLGFSDIRDNDPEVEKRLREEARVHCHDTQVVLAGWAIELGYTKDDLIWILEAIGLPHKVPVEAVNQPKE